MIIRLFINSQSVANIFYLEIKIEIIDKIRRRFLIRTTLRTIYMLARRYYIVSGIFVALYFCVIYY